MSCTIAEVKKQLESVSEIITKINKLLDSCQELKRHRFTIRTVLASDDNTDVNFNGGTTPYIKPHSKRHTLKKKIRA